MQRIFTRSQFPNIARVLFALGEYTGTLETGEDSELIMPESFKVDFRWEPMLLVLEKIASQLADEEVDELLESPENFICDAPLSLLNAFLDNAEVINETCHG